jgi:hypothetical protein
VLSRERGAARIDLNTSETDVAARAPYESAGFTNREGGPRQRLSEQAGGHRSAGVGLRRVADGGRDERTRGDPSTSGRAQPSG